MRTINRKSRNRVFTAKRSETHTIPARLKVNGSMYKRVRIDLSKTNATCIHYLDKEWNTVYIRGRFIQRTHTNKHELLNIRYKTTFSFHSKEGDSFCFKFTKKNYDIFEKKTLGNISFEL